MGKKKSSTLNYGMAQDQSSTTKKSASVTVKIKRWFFFYSATSATHFLKIFFKICPVSVKILPIILLVITFIINVLATSKTYWIFFVLKGGPDTLSWLYRLCLQLLFLEAISNISFQKTYAQMPQWYHNLLKDF